MGQMYEKKILYIKILSEKNRIINFYYLLLLLRNLKKTSNYDKCK